MKRTVRGRQGVTPKNGGQKPRPGHRTEKKLALEVLREMARCPASTIQETATHHVMLFGFLSCFVRARHGRYSPSAWLRRRATNSQQSAIRDLVKAAWKDKQILASDIVSQLGQMDRSLAMRAADLFERFADLLEGRMLPSPISPYEALGYLSNLREWLDGMASNDEYLPSIMSEQLDEGTGEADALYRPLAEILCMKVLIDVFATAGEEMSLIIDDANLKLARILTRMFRRLKAARQAAISLSPWIVELHIDSVQWNGMTGSCYHDCGRQYFADQAESIYRLVRPVAFACTLKHEPDSLTPEELCAKWKDVIALTPPLSDDEPRNLMVRLGHEAGRLANMISRSKGVNVKPTGGDPQYQAQMVVELGKGPVTVNGKPLDECRLPDGCVHSPCFTSVRWCGKTYFPFSRNQAACIRELWAAYEKGVPDVNDEWLLTHCNIANERMDAVFRGHTESCALNAPGYSLSLAV